MAVQRFWDVFKACVEENRIRPDRSPFYVKWAQAFVWVGVSKKVSCHTLRHSGVYPATGGTTHLLDRLRHPHGAGAIGACDASTTMIYTHVLNRPGLSVRSPADI